MISPSPSRPAACSRRALARTSSTDRSEESSMYSGDGGEPSGGGEDLRPAALLDPALAQVVALDRRPARRRSAARARPRTSRARTARRPCSCSSAAFSAKLATSADLPIDGRAARMIRLPGWKPPVMSSRSLKPDGVPVRSPSGVESFCSLSSSRSSRSPIGDGSPSGGPRGRPRGSPARPGRPASRGGASWSSDAGLDLVGRVQQPAQQRVLADDPRVLADVADGGRRRGEHVDRRAPPTCVELAASARRCSATVSASTGSPPVWRSSIARKTMPCGSR